jgi:hypothetical protein
MTIPLFDSPEDAAMQGFPRENSRVVATRVKGDDAYVLLDTGPRGQPYLYGVYCSRHDGRWRGDSPANGPGWSQAGADPTLGTLVVWDLAPAGTDRVRVEFAGGTVEEPVTDIAYLAVWWCVSDPQHDWPTVLAFRIHGQWIAAAAG